VQSPLSYLLRCLRTWVTPPPAGPLSLSEVIDNASSRLPRLRASRERARILLTKYQLNDWPLLHFLRRDPDLRFFVYSDLVHSISALTRIDPGRALNDLDAVTDLAIRLPPPGSSAQTLRFSIAIERGNILRVLARYTDARQAFRDAEDLDHAPDPDDRVCFLSYQASLATDLRHYQDAQRFITRAVNIARAHVPRELPRLYVQAGVLAMYMDDPSAEDLLAVAVRLSTSNPTLRLIAAYNRALALLYSGRVLPAYRQLQMLTPEPSSVPVLIQARLLWLRGAILSHLGQTHDAVDCLEPALARFQEASLPEEILRTTAELAVLYARLGYNGRARDLILEALASTPASNDEGLLCDLRRGLSALLANLIRPEASDLLLAYMRLRPLRPQLPFPVP
jgi:tetratricopeptide (TPR) repeat protein